MGNNCVAKQNDGENNDMILDQNSEILIYQNRNFLGVKVTLTGSSTHLSFIQFLTENVSIKIKGAEPWTLYSDTNMKGKAFTLNPGEYSNLSDVIPAGHPIHSVHKESEKTVPLSTLEYPHGQKYAQQWAALAAWFLGPKAENINIFNELAVAAFKGNSQFRKNYYPTDPAYITSSVKSTDAYRGEIANTKQELETMIIKLQNSVPNASIRFEGHMCWDTNMPANLGYLAALLYNANNVANEASPVTTPFEIDVGDQMCEMLGFPQDPKPWGHITADGSIANIEAMWSSRNVKFYPLSVQRALSENDKLASARNYMVYVPRLEEKEKLIDLCTWDALNLDIDDIINMPEDIRDMAGISADELNDIIAEYNLANIGWFDFMTMFNMSKQPVVIGPMSMHYSWPKSASLLGLGQRSLIGVEYDKNARMDITDLKRKLSKCLKEEVAVISVVAVIGTTEESAIDPLQDIVNMRKKFREKGLNFAINADAAWGGYFMSMLHCPPLNSPRALSDQGGYVPSFPLSNYTETHLHALKYADTVTVDPHKSGFCPYPAGSLSYRNGNMRSFVKVEADVVFHKGIDPSVGIWGVEGSKPGAAPAGVLLAHNVIGLDSVGYGRILGQCTLGGKLFYCMWLTLAEEVDNFVCVPMKPLPDGMTLAYAISFIKERITEKSNEDLEKDFEAMAFLKAIGPDTVINAFAVNIKGNTDLKVCNALTFQVFRFLSHTNDNQNVKRIPMILTQSQLPPMKFGEAVKQFKERLGIPRDSEGGLNFLINTVMNPWVADRDQISILRMAFKQTVWNAIGKLTDEPANHSFVCSGVIDPSTGVVFGEHIPSFGHTSEQYQAIAKFKFMNTEDINVIHQKLVEQQNLSAKKRKPIVFVNTQKCVLQTFLDDAMEGQQEVTMYIGNPNTQSNTTPFITTQVKVLDIPRCQHFDMTATSYPKHMTYFMYGDGDKAFLSHNITMNPDFFQVVQLEAKPHSVPDDLLTLGIDVTIESMEGKPLVVKGQIVDPLQLPSYTIEFKSIGGFLVATTMELANKVFFDASSLNN